MDPTYPTLDRLNIGVYCHTEDDGAKIHYVDKVELVYVLVAKGLWSKFKRSFPANVLPNGGYAAHEVESAMVRMLTE